MKLSKYVNNLHTENFIASREIKDNLNKWNNAACSKIKNWNSVKIESFQNSYTGGRHAT